MRRPFAERVVTVFTAILGLGASACSMAADPSPYGAASQELSSTALVVSEEAWANAPPSCEGVAFAANARVALAEGAPSLGVVVDDVGIECVDSLTELGLSDLEVANEGARAEVGRLVPLVGSAPYAGDPSPHPNRPTGRTLALYGRLGGFAFGDPSPHPNGPEDHTSTTGRTATR